MKRNYFFESSDKIKWKSHNSKLYAIMAFLFLSLLVSNPKNSLILFPESLHILIATLHHAVVDVAKPKAMGEEECCANGCHYDV